MRPLSVRDSVIDIPFTLYNINYVSISRLQEITHQPLVVVPRIARRVMPAGPPSGHHASGTPHRGVAVHPGQHIGHQGTPQMPNRPIQSQSSSTPSSQAISTQSKSLPQKRMNQSKCSYRKPPAINY